MIKITYKRSGVEDYREFRNKEEFEDCLIARRKLKRSPLSIRASPNKDSFFLRDFYSFSYGNR